MQVYVRRIVVALGVVVSLTASAVLYANWFIDDAVRNDHHRTDVRTVATLSGRPENYLIIGSDSRGFVKTAIDREHFGTAAGNAGQRSDTIMIAHIDPNGRGTLLVSFPRDLWVSIPGHGTAKINAAFNHGPQTVIDTIEQNFHIPINHYLEVDFAGFKNVVDSIGTVDLFFPTIARDLMTGLFVTTPGCNSFDGARALQYVRSRHYEYRITAAGRWHSDPTSDFGRIRRQQYFIRSMAQAAIHRAMSNPLTITSIVHSALRSLTADRALDAGGLVHLANAMRSTDPGAVAMETIPADGARSPDGQDILRVRAADAEPILEQLRSTSSSGPTVSATQSNSSIPPSGVTVRVLNGTTHQGAAAKALDDLARAGFHRDTAGNAPFKLVHTEVRYGTGDRARTKAEVVAAHLGGVGRLIPDDTILDDVVVVALGADFTHVGTGSAPTTSVTHPSLSSSTLPPNPGHTTGVTVPPTEAGRPLVGCG